MEVEFIKSPTGSFNLAYFVGDKVEIKDKDLLKKLLKGKFVKPVAKKAADNKKTADETEKETRAKK